MKSKKKGIIGNFGAFINLPELSKERLKSSQPVLVQQALCPIRRKKVPRLLASGGTFQTHSGRVLLLTARVSSAGEAGDKEYV